MKIIQFRTDFSFAGRFMAMALMFLASCSSSGGSDDGPTPEVDQEAPTAPTGLTAENITQTTARLSWDAATDNVGVQNYAIYQDGVFLTSSGQFFYALDDLEPGTTYSYQVLAIDQAGNESPLSTVLELTTMGSITAELQYESGNIDTYLRNLIDNVPGSGQDGYTAPVDAQLDLWEAVVGHMLNDQISEAVAKSAELNYQITEFTDNTLSPNQVFYVLAEYDSAKTNYWGIYVFSATPESEDLILMAPHIKYDTNTGYEAAYSFRNNVAKALLLSSAHRCNSDTETECSGTTSACGSSGAYRISDLAHNTDSAFQRTTEVIATSLPSTVFVQLHGFGKGDNDPDVIMSNGTDQIPDTDYASLIRDALSKEDASLTFKIAHIDTDWSRLRGFTNTQGRFINSSPDPCGTSATETSGRFIHIEQARPKLRQDASGWAKMSNALGTVFK
ncbi:fibronectin type III domain-containing protein [Muricauda sp. NFXS6]|uniref:fibronectin type III domain-containing protein n=1 Tax=Allomuricauda sp. NFXS6 TaxID=2819094 RepID=UPI0032DFE08A